MKIFKNAKSNMITSADKRRALNSMNEDDNILGLFGTSESDGLGNYIPDMPESQAGGVRINLIRANLDEAKKVVMEIDAELKELDVRKQQLLIQRQAHEELRIVAEKYTKLLSEFSNSLSAK